jgi:hypothetical protein
MLVKTHVLSQPHFASPVHIFGEDKFYLSIHPLGVRLLKPSKNPSQIISSIDGSYLSNVSVDVASNEGRASMLALFEEMRDSVLSQEVIAFVDGKDYGPITVGELLSKTRIENKLSDSASPVYRAEAMIDLSDGSLSVAVPYRETISIHFSGAVLHA